MHPDRLIAKSSDGSGMPQVPTSATSDVLSRAEKHAADLQRQLAEAREYHMKLEERVPVVCYFACVPKTQVRLLFE